MNNVIHHSLFGELDIYLFKAGKHSKVYDKMGSHILEVDGVRGTYFAVWAPNALNVSVIGNFNYWNKSSHPLTSRWDGSGIWEGFIPNIDKGTLYKYYITSNTGEHLEKTDPYARFFEIPPKTASIVWNDNYEWKDSEWLNTRLEKAGQPQPYSVYEVHLGSWFKKHGGAVSLSYRELGEELVKYVSEMGFTHVEFLPVMEHPYYPSWGYQITGYFAPTSRFGVPEDFKYLIDQFHQAGIGVILDWVPSHFPMDEFAIAKFDGTYLYEHADPRKGFHPDWKSAIFNYSRNEVRSFLISNALFWMEQYHADGLRVDAVASMLYLDYSRKEGEWIPNQYGGRENLDAISLLKEFNETIYKAYPDAVTIAEESTAWPGVSRPAYTGGLGFGQKWMMGWMHDTLKYFKQDPLYRKYHHHDITFSLVYAFTENFMLPLSHDEVVHGKKSLLYKMPGDEWQRFANLRLLFGYMFTHPGTKLLFMGAEFAQSSEWSEEKGLEWWLLEFPYHKGVRNWVKVLNQYYRSTPALYEEQFDQQGFEWIELNDGRNSIVSYLRKGKAGSKTQLVVCNFTPITHQAYKLGCPTNGLWRQALNSDEVQYGGSGVTNHLTVQATNDGWHFRPFSLTIVVPPLAILVFESLD